MEFHQIRYFLCASDELNFTKAADVCNVSQPALTKAIQKLEANLGGSLFDRDGRQVTLTNLGRSMQIHLKKIETARAFAHNQARSLVDNETETLHVGIMCTLGSDLIQPAIRKFRTNYGRGQVTFHEIWSDKGKEMLLSGAVDCVFFAKDQVANKAIDHIDLYDESVGLVVATSHPLATKTEIFLSDITQYPYADRLRCEFRDGVLDVMSKKELNLDVSVRSEREDWIKGFVKAGTHIAIMPQNSALSDHFVFRPIADLPSSRKVCIATASIIAPSKILQSFVSIVTKHFCE